MIPTKLIKRPSPDDESIKHAVMTYYGPLCTCPDCGESRLAKLTLDHVSGGGNLHRAASKRQGSSFYREVYTRIQANDEEWLSAFTVLCERCNNAKRDNFACDLDHVLGALAQDTLGVTTPLPHEADGEVEDSNTDGADPAKVKIQGRVKDGTRKWIRDQPEDIGSVIDRLVDEKRSGEAHLLAELRMLRAEVREVKDLVQSPTPPVQTDDAMAQPPWRDPEQWTAWEAFRQQWDAEHGMETPYQPPSPYGPRRFQPLPPTRWERLRRWLGL